MEISVIISVKIQIIVNILGKLLYMFSHSRWDLKEMHYFSLLLLTDFMSP